ncbi:hypothetical protein T09_14340 [Trichinella sp. T9]|nr:hypothetical protein T09_14340 [Trichinella sp. T9]
MQLSLNYIRQCTVKIAEEVDGIEYKSFEAFQLAFFSCTITRLGLFTVTLLINCEQLRNGNSSIISLCSNFWFISICCRRRNICSWSGKHLLRLNTARSWVQCMVVQ